MEKLPERKPTRLKEYDYSNNGAYFVTVCTKDRQKVLSNIVGEGFPLPKLLPQGKIVDDVIKEIPQKYNCVKIDKYVIMPDHIHLLISITEIGGRGNPSPTIETVMGWFKYQATKKINQATGNVGKKVFQRSFFDHIIRNENDYREIWEYIENNPRRSGKTNFILNNKATI